MTDTDDIANNEAPLVATDDAIPPVANTMDEILPANSPFFESFVCSFVHPHLFVI